MEIDFNKKYNIKIRDKDTNEFVSPSYNNKKTWQRLSDVAKKFKEGRLNGQCNTLKKPISKYNVVLFPLDEGQEIEAADFLEIYLHHRKEKEKSKAERKQEQEANRRRDKINSLLKEVEETLGRAPSRTDIVRLLTSRLIGSENKALLKDALHSADSYNISL